MRSYTLSSTIGICCQECSRYISMVTAMWSVSNRTGTSNSKSAVTLTLSAGAVLKVTSSALRVW
jgi:hypothetical protein